MTEVTTIKAREVDSLIEVRFGEIILYLTPTLGNDLGQYLIDAARVIVSKPVEDKAHDKTLDLELGRRDLHPWQDPDQDQGLRA